MHVNQILTGIMSQLMIM